MPLDINTYNEILKEKYWVFTAGKYPQGEFSVRDILEIADNYDTEFCEAPLWVGHPEPEKEPEALAWVGRAIAEGENLYVQFSYIDDELVYMIERKRFKRVSIELWRFAEKPGWYLYAIGLTNRPQIKNLKPIEFAHSGLKSVKFSEDKVIEKMSVNLNCRLVFTEKTKEAIHKPKQSNDMKSEEIKKFAADRKIEIPKDASEQEVLAVVFKYVDRQTELLKETQAQVAKFSENSKTLEDQINELKAKEVGLVVEFGINAKRIVTEQKEFYTKFGMEHGADKLKEMINTLPVQTLFAENQIKDTKTGPGAKFKNADGSDLTYADYLKKSLENPKFAEAFTDEEVAKLKQDTW